MPGFVSKFLDFVGIEEIPRDDRGRQAAYDDYDERDNGYTDTRSRFETRARDERGSYERGQDRGYDRDERPSFARERGGYDSDRSRKKGGGGKVVNHPAADMSQHQMRIYQMEDYDDARSVIDDLLADRSVLINLELVDVDTSQRIVDMLSGATYALGASLKKAAANTYLLAPLSVEISGSYEEEDNRRRSSIFGARR